MAIKTTNWNCPECGDVRSSKRCPKCEPTADEMMDWLESVCPAISRCSWEAQPYEITWFEGVTSRGSDLRAAIRDAIKKGQ